MNNVTNNTEARCDTLYYDGACPLCNAEITRLRELADDRLALVDVHDLPETARPPESVSESELKEAPGFGELPGRVALLRNLHYRRADGTLLSGLDANVAAWQHTRLGPLWRWLRWPLIRPLADRVYAFWAERRYQGLYLEDGRRRG